MSSTPPDFPFGSADDLFSEMNRMMATPVDGPVAWDLAVQTAIAMCEAPALAAGSAAGRSAGPEAASTTHFDVDASLRVADLWIDPVTSWPSGIAVSAAWSPVDWVHATLPVWKRLCDPVARSVARTMQETMGDGLRAIQESTESGEDLTAQLREALPEGVELPEGFDLHQVTAAIGPLMGMLEHVSAVMLGGQIGQAIGRLATEVQTSSDIGIPLGLPGTAAMLPAAVGAYAEGLQVDLDQVGLYLALREAAHQRLYAHVPWLRAHVLAAVEAYAAGVSVDPEALQRRVSEAFGDLEPEALADPERLQQAIASGLFSQEPSPTQELALNRLETLLALIEGWVEHVAGKAAQGRLPGLDALRESVRRRRAAGGPAEHTFAALVGLDLRPKRLRTAAGLWEAIEQKRGSAGRDSIWEHPDLLPSSADLDDPLDFLSPPSDTAQMPDGPEELLGE